MILCSGAFDGLHVGHVRYLQAASLFRESWQRPREELIVAVAPDAYIRAHKHREPQWNTVERMTVVQALSDVDAVYVHTADGAADAITRLRPRLFIKGKDWEGRLPDDVLKACSYAGTAIVFVVSGVDQHTSDLKGAA